MTQFTIPITVFEVPSTVHWGLILLFTAIAIGCFTGATYESRLQGRDTQLGLKAVLLTNGLWLSFQALGLVTTDEILSSALYIGGLICGLTGVGAWIYFVSAYTGRSYHRDRRYRGLAVTVYVGLLVVKLTNPLYGLYVSTRVLQNPYPHLVVEPQLFFWVSFSITYTLVAISFYWLLDTIRRSASPTAGLGVLAVFSLLPVVPRVATQALPNEVLPPVVLGLSFEPIGVTGFMFGVLLFVEEPFRQVEQSARSKFFDEADDATFVYNIDGRLVEMNDQAQTLQSDLNVECSTIKAFESAFRPVGTDADERNTITAERDGTPRRFEVTTNSMTTGTESIGVVAIVRDITERWARKRDLELKERAMDEANVGITISDPTSDDNPLVYVNDGFVEQTGYDRTEAVGRNCRFLQDDDRDQSAIDDLREAIAADEPITVELRNYRKDGEQFRNRLSVTPIFNEAGELVNHVGIQQDVTTVRESQRELRAERERFELLTESTDEYAFFIVDDDGEIETWNDGAANLFGYDTATALEMSMADLHPAADREAELPDRLLQQVRHAGEAEDTGWRVRADGTEFYADARYAALRDDDGNLAGYAQIVRDMTEQRRQQRRTERFVEESDDVVTIVDQDGTITYASGSAEPVFGYSVDDLTETNLFDRLHPDDRERAMEAFFRGTDDDDAAFQIDCRFMSHDEEWREVELRCRNMLADSAISGMLMYLRDVTATKARTRQLEALFNGTFGFAGLLEPDSTILRANDAAIEFGGFDREDIVGQRFDTVSWWTHSTAVQDRVRNATRRAATGEFVRYETDVQGTDGLQTIDFSVKPVTNDAGDVTLLVVEGRIVTTERRQQQYMAIMQRIMRHNIRNDINKLRGWSEMLAEEVDAETRTTHLHRIERILDEWETMTEQVKQLRQLVNTPEADQSVVETRTVLEHLTERSEEAGVTLNTESSLSDAPATLVPAAIDEALQRLVAIAIDRSTDQDTDVEISVSNATDDWVEIILLVTGSELTEMEVSVLATGEETALTHAQGLDVWLIRTMVQQAGGGITGQTTDGKTRITLRAPTSEPPHPEP